MKPRTQFLIGAGSVLAVAGYLMASSISETGMYYVTPTELATKLASDPSLHGVDVVVEGRMGQDGTFQATTLLAKCASRYENAPEKYRDTPGYKAAANPRA